MKFNIKVSVYGKYCSLWRCQENHEILKFKRNSLSGKGTSYLITPFFKKSTTKSGMITALYADRRQNQNWHLNLNIPYCWFHGTQLPRLKLFFFLLWMLVTDGLQFGMLSGVIGCTAHTSPLLHFWHPNNDGQLVAALLLLGLVWAKWAWCLQEGSWDSF